MSIFSRFARKQAEQKVAKEIEKELGNKTLSYVSKVVRGLIPTYGVARVRQQVIENIEKDLKHMVKKNPKATVDKLIEDVVNTPDYMALLKDLGMNEDHLKILAQDALEGK